MPDINGNMKKFTVIGPNGQKYIMIPVDTEARQAIDEAKDLEFDEDVFNLEETDSSVKVGAHLVPIGVDDETPLEIVQDTQEGLVLGSKASFSTALAPAFDATSTYAVGDTVTYKGKLYKCTTAVQTAGEWTGSTNWTETQITSAVKDVSIKSNNPLKLTESGNSVTLEVDSAFSESIAPAFNTTTSYAIGDTVTYNNKVYVCSTATSGSWDNSKWNETSVSQAKTVMPAANNPLQVISRTSSGVTLGVDSLFNSSIANNFNPSITYTAGSKVIYQNKLYKCTSTSSTPNMWNPNDWQEIQLSNDVYKIYDYNDAAATYSSIYGAITQNYLVFCRITADTTTSGATLPKGSILSYAFSIHSSHYSYMLFTKAARVEYSTGASEDGIFIAKVNESDVWSLEFVSIARLANIAAPLNSGSYKAGDLSTYDGKLYIANQSLLGPNFDSNKWNQTTVSALISSVDISQFSAKTQATISAISGSKAVKLHMGNGSEYQFAKYDSVNDKVTFMSEVLEIGSDREYPPNSTFAGVGYTLNNGSDVATDERRAINGGLHNNTTITPIVAEQKTTLTIANNTHTNIGAITTSGLEIVIKSFDRFQQSPHAAFEFSKASGTGNFTVSVRYETETTSTNLNLVCPGWVSGGSTAMYLYTGSYGLHIMGNTGIITVIETDAPST